ncbi:MAG TPA: CorA family divalent cation transporter, partial [Rhodoblastus sp.]|nr:CorA family divalent cation transporter [Rhodoblastus sp.]
RLYSDRGFLYMSTPMTVRANGGLARSTPLGFVLGHNFTLTIRFAAMKPCDDLHTAKANENERGASGPNAFIMVVENIIDAMADDLERINADIDHVAQIIFEQGGGGAQGGAQDVIRDNAMIKRSLGAISGNGYLTAKTSDTLLGISRMLAFVSGEARSVLSGEENAKLKSMVRDVASLIDYTRSQNDRLQLLLDAALGLTNIEQNNIFRLLTVVSVIGIPPTLIASMYGMNFKNMPELEWSFGYEWGLALIVLSALIPAIWFKRRGWW